MKMVKLSKEVLNKLARKGGVKSMSSFTYKEMNGVVLSILGTFLKKCVLITESNNRKTITLDDVKYTFDFLGRKLYTYDENIPKCKPITVKKNTKSRYLKEIRFYQNQSDCLYIPKATFKKMVMAEIENMKISSVALDHLQATIETICIELFEKANKLAITHGRRTTVQPKDIHAVRFILGEYNILI